MSLRPTRSNHSTSSRTSSNPEKQVTLDELKSGYMMQADYTRKTQQLAQERNQVVQAYTQDIQRFAQEAQQTAQQARAVLEAFMGQRSPQEMYQLSMTDPAQYAQELARQNTLQAAMNGLNQEQQQLAAQAQQRLEQQQQELLQRSRQALLEAKVTAKDLSAISENVPKYYGFTREELNSVKDHRIVLALRDAIQFRQLKSAKPEAMKRTANVAPMPRTGKAPEPQQLRASRELTARFQSGRANVGDLAALISPQRR